MGRQRSRFAWAAALTLAAMRAWSAPGVAKVENGGLLFTDNQAGVSGVDAGFSAPIGRQTLWLFGDVFLLHPTKPAKPYVGGVSNCGLLVPAGRGPAVLKRYTFLTDPKTVLARQLVPNEGSENEKTRLWPAASWYDAAHKRLYTYYGIIRTTGSGMFDFKGEGEGLAVADVSRPERLAFRRLKASDGDFWWRSDGPTFGQAVIPVNGWLYVVGERGGGVRAAVLARVRPAAIADPAAYEYYAGMAGATPRWSRSRADCANVPGLADFPSEVSVAWNPYLGGYLAVHNVVLEDRIRLCLGPKPWGPFRTIAEIGAPRMAFQKNPVYAGKQHPELSEDGGRIIYVTYVDSQRYWLQLLKVTLAR